MINNYIYQSLITNLILSDLSFVEHEGIDEPVEAYLWYKNCWNGVWWRAISWWFEDLSIFLFMPFSCFYPVSWAKLIPTLRKMYRSLFFRNDDEFLFTPCVWWFAFAIGVNVGAEKGSISSRANNEHSRIADPHT